jgi:hypothetical protein
MQLRCHKTKITATVRRDERGAEGQDNAGMLQILVS